MEAELSKLSVVISSRDKKHSPKQSIGFISKIETTRTKMTTAKTTTKVNNLFLFFIYIFVLVLLSTNF